MPRMLPKCLLSDIATCVVALVIVFQSRSLHGGTPPDPLWRNAVEVAATNSGWVPGLIVIRSEVFHKGEPVATHEMWQRSTLNPQGELVTKTIRVLEDGKDVTKQSEKETKSKRPEKNDTAMGAWKAGFNPFAREAQERIALKPTERARLIAGRDCVGYAFVLKQTNGAVAKGTAWLDKQTGIPAEIEEMQLDPLPEKHFKSMSLTTRYETTNGVWRVKALEMTGTVSVLFIKAGVKSITEFSEHWKKP